MKKILCICICLLLFVCSKAQENNNKDLFKKIHKFFRSAQLHKCHLNGVLSEGADETEDILPGYEFKIIDQVDDFYIIRFSKWTNENYDYLNTKLNGMSSQKNSANANPNFMGDDEIIYFKLPLKIFSTKCELAFSRHSFTVGGLVLPIKIRFGAKSADGTIKRDFTFSGDASVGLSAGYKYTGNGTVSHNFLTGLAITSVSVSPATTNKFVTAETNLAAITWHFGYLLEIDRFQFGAFTGIDYLAGEAGRQWMYRHKPWLGVGLGFSFLNHKKTTDTQ